MHKDFVTVELLQLSLLTPLSRLCTMTAAVAVTWHNSDDIGLSVRHRLDRPLALLVRLSTASITLGWHQEVRASDATDNPQLKARFNVGLGWPGSCSCALCDCSRSSNWVRALHDRPIIDDSAVTRSARCWCT